jgi:hypothetical protein
MEKDTLGRTTFDIMQHPGVVSSSFRERGRRAAAGDKRSLHWWARCLSADGFELIAGLFHVQQGTSKWTEPSRLRNSDDHIGKCGSSQSVLEWLAPQYQKDREYDYRATCSLLEWDDSLTQTCFAINTSMTIDEHLQSPTVGDNTHHHVRIPRSLAKLEGLHLFSQVSAIELIAGLLLVFSREIYLLASPLSDSATAGQEFAPKNQRAA